MSEKKIKKFSIKTFLQEIFSTFETVLISIFAVSMIFTYVFRISTVNGRSMENTLIPDDKIISASLFTAPKSGDIVIIEANESVIYDEANNLKIGTGLDKQIVKRVIACEGQKVFIDFEKGTVSVDDKILNETYINELTHLDEGAFTGKYPVIVPAGYYFVLGDNRGISKDSRSLEIGFIRKDAIIGKVIMIISPFERIGFIK